MGLSQFWTVLIPASHGETQKLLLALEFKPWINALTHKTKISLL
jgi:hypothetical protein